jgi:hypothetical protein
MKHLAAPLSAFFGAVVLSVLVCGGVASAAGIDESAPAAPQSIPPGVPPNVPVIGGPSLSGLLPPSYQSLLSAGKLKVGSGDGARFAPVPTPPSATSSRRGAAARSSSFNPGGVILCTAYADSPGNGGNKITARGHAECDDYVDLLASQACWYIWPANPPYAWSFLACGTPYSYAPASYVKAIPYTRTCTTGRYYLESNYSSAVENASADSANQFYSTYNQCRA